MIGRKSFLIMLSRLTSAALAFIGLYFISRYLSPGVYGSIGFTIALFTAFKAIADLGLTTTHIKKISEGEPISDCLSTFVISKLVLIGLMIAVTVGSLLVWTRLLGQPLGSTSVELLILFMLYFVFYDVSSIAIATFDARQETAKTQLSMIADPLLRTPLIVFVSLNRLGANELAFAYVIGGLGVAVVSLLLLYREGIPWCRPTRFRPYIRFAVPIAMFVIMSAFIGNLDKISLGLFWSPEQVGLYGAGQSFLLLFGVIGTSVSVLTLPEFSKLHTEGRMTEIRGKTRDAERYIMMLSLPLLLLFVIYPFNMSLILLGPNFVDSGIPMPFLAVSTFLSLLMGVYNTQLYAVNRPDLAAKAILGSLLTLIVLLLVLVPPSLLGMPTFGLGMTGAAIAALTSTVVMFIAIRVMAHQLTRSGFNKGILWHLMAALASAIVLYELQFVWEMGHFPDLIGYALISVGVYSTILYMVKQLTREDIRFFLSVINPSEMGRYISSELRRKN